MPVSQSTSRGKSPLASRKCPPKLKVIIRRLPPSLTEAEFLKVVQPLPNHDYFYFATGSAKSGPMSYTRAYINFASQADLVDFGMKFDNYVFLDDGGNEFQAVVEYAPQQRLPRTQPRPVAGGGFYLPGSGEIQMGPLPKSKADLSGTYESDPLFQEFIKKMNAAPVPGTVPTPEDFLAEIEARERELKANNGRPQIVTPLIAYVRQRAIENEKKREVRRDERFKREQEMRKQKDDDQRKKKDRNEGEVPERRERQPATTKSPKGTKFGSARKERAEEPPWRRERERNREKEEIIPTFKLLKKPQPEEKKDEKPETKPERKEPPTPKKEKAPAKPAVFIPSRRATYKQKPAPEEEESKTKDEPKKAHQSKKEPREERESAAATAAREKRRTRARPSIEIYRPPPRRGGGWQSGSATTPEPPRESPEPQKKLRTSGAWDERRDKRIARTSEGDRDERKEEGFRRRGGQKSMTFSRSKNE